MSADNWAICPRCSARQLREIRDREAAANAAYGVLPIAEWKVLDEAARLIPAPKQTLREDYEIGVVEDRLCIDYSGSCYECRLTVRFTHESIVEGIDQ